MSNTKVTISFELPTDHENTVMYSTQGSVRGSCPHKHRSLRTALLCVQKDQKGCASVGGYSDRRVVHFDGSPLTETEAETLQELEEDHWI